MAGSSADRAIEWEGGSLAELVAALQSAALPVRIEVIAPGTTDSNAGEVHLLAGGLADAFAGSLRRDDAMAALQRLEGARFLVESRLPDPETGSLSEPGPGQGSLTDRPLASLMRYCEDYVLTCRLEVRRGQDGAVISYRRGEIVSTTVGGSEGSERLPEVMAWNEGSYDIVLEAPVLPPAPAKKREIAAASGRPGERKRHTTLPLGPAGSGQSEGSTSARPGSTPPPVPPMRGVSSTTPSPRAASLVTGQPLAAKPPSVTGTAGAPKPAKPAASADAQSAQPPVQRAPAHATAQPAHPATPAGIRPPTQAAPRPEMQARESNRPATATKPAPETPVMAPQKPAVRRMVPVPPKAGPIAPVPIAQLPPEMTARGTPPVPAVPLVPPPASQAPRTMAPAAHVPIAQASKSAAPAPVAPKPGAPASPPAAARPGAPSVAAKPAIHVSGSMGDKPAVGPGPAAVKPAAPATGKLAEPAAKNPPGPAPGSPQAQVPTEPAPAVQARASKSVPAASNDLLPASGTIEAKPKHAHQLPPPVAPVEVSAESVVAPTQQPSTPVVIPTRAPTPKRPHRVRKGVSEQSLKVYILIGLAIGAGVVLAYWAYWYLPFGHR